MYRLSYQFTILSSSPLSERPAGSEQILNFVWLSVGSCFPALPGFVVRIADHCIGSINFLQGEARIFGACRKRGDSGHTLDVLIRKDVRRKKVEVGGWIACVVS